MRYDKGCITEIYLEGRYAALITCPVALVPAPGQYVLAFARHEPDSALATPLYSAGACSAGFFVAGPLPYGWIPGTELELRGPLGHGFVMPVTARFVGLAAIGVNTSRVLALLEPALAQKAAVVVLADQPPSGLPAAVEISPLAQLSEIAAWADYLAIDIHRYALQENIRSVVQQLRTATAQVFVDTAMPCGGMAECGICAVNMRTGYQLACKDGPVFDLRQLRFEG